MICNVAPTYVIVEVWIGTNGERVDVSEFPDRCGKTISVWHSGLPYQKWNEPVHRRKETTLLIISVAILAMVVWLAFHILGVGRWRSARQMPEDRRSR
jgi:hypothetical protein